MKTDYPLYDEVWCSPLDFEMLKRIFIQTPLVQKTYISNGKVILMKRGDVITRPGFEDTRKNSIIMILKVT